MCSRSTLHGPSESILLTAETTAGAHISPICSSMMRHKLVVPIVTPMLSSSYHFISKERLALTQFRSMLITSFLNYDWFVVSKKQFSLVKGMSGSIAIIKHWL
jgi:hypothetical protein